MRRTQTPIAAPSPQLKPALTLDQWESKAPLSQSQTKNVNAVKNACESRRLPAKFSAEAEEISRPSTPVNKQLALNTASPRPGTPPLKNPHPLHPSQPITTPQLFHDWFALIDKSISHSQEAHFRAHLASVSSHLNTCDSLLEQVQAIDDDVLNMTEDWKGVEEGGQSLQGACERMLEERDRLIQVTDALEERLEYFQELEIATRMLNYPGDSLVLQTDFLLMVERVDVCIEFLQAHREYKDSQVYLLRFHQCMTRAMTLIKIHFVGALKALQSEIQKRLSDKSISSTTVNLLLYSKFQTASNQLAPLLLELERRALAHPDDLQSLLTECHTAYFTCRKALVSGRLAEEIKGLDPARSEVVELTQAGCSYLKQLCVDEFSLYRRFFDSGEDKLYRYLETLCDYLYDDLRPRILHEPKLTVLCQVCTVIQALMILDVSTDYGDEYDEVEPSPSQTYRSRYSRMDSLPITPSLRELKEAQTPLLEAPHQTQPPPPTSRYNLNLRHLHIANLLESVLQDAQTRLFFKAQAVIQSEIRYYAPKDVDLDYPGKLKAFRDSRTANNLNVIEKGEGAGLGPLSRLPSLSKQSTWYPTLQKTHWVLSQLQDFVKPTIFEDMAHEAISLCRESLISAAELLPAKGSGDVADGGLFLIRHLLILKELTSALGLETITVQRGRAVDFSIVTDTLGSLLSSNGILGGYGGTAGGGGAFRAPKVVENAADAKLDLDAALKKACDDTISHFVSSVTSSLRQVISTTTPLPPSKATTATASTALAKAQQVHSEFMASLPAEIKTWIEKLKLYLDSEDDARTIGVLVSVMHGRIVDVYEEFKTACDVTGGAGLEGVLSNSEIWGWLRKVSE
ncbi:Golgi transport complex subunit 3 [Tulasnella sp. 419]|nr:Golgi transport complex subunit 3 [Tulasnella sp. 419]